MDEFITLSDYFMGRDVQYASELTREMKENAIRLLSVVNDLIREISPQLPGFVWKVNSGWRPPSINQSLGGSPKSNHQICKAVDIADPKGELDSFLLANQQLLVKRGCAIEHPDATPNWCHIQDILPHSGKTVFLP